MTKRTLHITAIALFIAGIVGYCITACYGPPFYIITLSLFGLSMLMVIGCMVGACIGKDKHEEVGE